MNSLETFLNFAIDAAWQAGRLTLAHYQTGVTVERKPDRSVVTIADREGEKLLRRLIEARFPEHAIAGEEFGDDSRDATHRWIVDPIDGTNSFVRGVPFFGVLVALEVAGECVVGVAYFPALDEMLAAARGLGCRWNGREARVSRVTPLSDACVAYTDGRDVAGRLGARWPALAQDTALQRGWGDCYGHALVATGRADVMLDPRMNPWDCAALIPIVQEAGGTFTDWQGRVTIHGGDAVSTNGVLHDEILARLGNSMRT
ncbi:MAG TPA: histidinol-phosphatase [Vicinamibacterales bacterium]|nr:histidinol-phosphatase [Vicinamibacterales bacterium]